MKHFFTFCIICLLLANSNCQTKKTMIDKTTVANLDLNRYLGTWYEIARFQNSVEKDLVGVTATYSLMNNGKIKVLNQGYKNTLNGKLSTA